MKLVLPPSLQKAVDVLFKKHKKVAPQRDASGDWHRIIGIFIFIVLIIIALDGFFFYKLNRGELFVTEEPDVQVEIFDRSLLKENNAYYDAQEDRYMSLQSAPTEVIDPSL